MLVFAACGLMVDLFDDSDHCMFEGLFGFLRQKPVNSLKPRCDTAISILARGDKHITYELVVQHRSQP